MSVRRKRAGMVAAATVALCAIGVAPAHAAPDPRFADAQVAAVQNNDGRLEIFAVDRAGTLWHKWASQPDPLPDSDWAALPGATVLGPVSAVVRTDGVVEVFARGVDDHLERIARDGIFGTWTGWRDFGDNLGSTPSAVLGPDARVQVFVRRQDDQVVFRTELSPTSNDYQPFAVIPGFPVLGAPVAIVRDTGIDVFARGTGNKLRHAQWIGSVFRVESVDSPYGGNDPFTRDPAVAVDHDKLPGVFVRTPGGQVRYAAPYRALNGSVQWLWESVGSLPGSTDQPAATLDRYYGYPRVYGVANGIGYTNRVTNSFALTGWQSLGGGIVSGISALITSDGAQDVFGVNGDERVVAAQQAFHQYETWKGWKVL